MLTLKNWKKINTKTMYDCGVNLTEFLRESNAIEGIHRDLTLEEFVAASKFLQHEIVTVESLCNLVKVFEPGTKLREKSGMNVKVGGHIPPRGGPFVRGALSNILLEALSEEFMPYQVHCHYETLHPFTDGNGRSGRMLWLWMMEQNGNRQASLGFLHAWYYQSLSDNR